MAWTAGPTGLVPGQLGVARKLGSHWQHFLFDTLMDHSNTASMDALHDEMTMPLQSITLVWEYEGSMGRDSGGIAPTEPQ